MTAYVRQGLADPRRPTKRLSFRERVADAARLIVAIANDKRLLTLIHLMDGERTVSDLLSPVGCTKHSISLHLRELVEHGVLECRAEGSWRYYSCKSEEAKAIIRLLDDLARNNELPAFPSGVPHRPRSKRRSR
ncbi:helix-turn-helix transcriptional regulator [Mesorhizobium sp. B3-1-3]|uniref:ArsR/SmtB family transcription factor n=1 Tax=unclassified Mesorhizobium TaxID=325217 RepID=UPI00112EF429|nr:MULTISPECIES: metalloregulator ArsR/SmtB family transcription factor [unclassified Mesorhizobium]TPI52668.1 helix-turn-helix transcriptional regulator [Mesorhizobium sp. B3-1-8]TPI59667.1 helix-turn-helix transcriptional regulator [Mesorhizobium sp. B3-1-3]